MRKCWRDTTRSRQALADVDLRYQQCSRGVPPTTVSKWAGKSVEVLFMICAKCLDGGAVVIRQRLDAALGNRPPA